MARRPLVWLNVVCLDAPLIACVWLWFFARTFGTALSMNSQVALFLTAWLIYLIDRFVDSASLPESSEKTAREMFCLRHTKAWIGVTVAVALSDAVFISQRLDRSTFAVGICVGTVATIYLVMNFAFSKVWSAIPIKEIAIGFLFAIGTLTPLLPSFLRIGSRTIIWNGGLAAFLFACVCSLNCMSIALWERDLDRLHGKHSIATRLAHPTSVVQSLAIIVALTCFLFRIVTPRLSALVDCLAISAVALLLLQFLAIRRDERTALADIVLLTPIGSLFMERVM